MPGKRKKRADGRYIEQVQIGFKENGKPKYKSIYANSGPELDKKVAAFRLELERGVIINDEGLTVKKWAESWLETYKIGKEYKTYQMYENAVKTHIIPAIGVIKLRDLKAYHVQGMINNLVSKGLTRTLEIVKTTLGQILEQAIKNDYIYKNVAKDIELPKIHKPLKRALTADEKRLIEIADLDIKCRTFLYFLLHTGVRRGEALALTKKDIDMRARKVYIDKSLVFKGNQPEIKPSPKSDAGFRTIPIPDALHSLLETYLLTATDSIYVFPSAKSKVMSETAFRRFWEKIYDCLNRAAGGGVKRIKGEDGKTHYVKAIVIADDITPHLFRHTYATMLYYSVVDIKTAQYLLGHSSIQMTMEIYTHLDAENNTAAMDKINAFLKPEKVKLAD